MQILNAGGKKIGDTRLILPPNFIPHQYFQPYNMQNEECAHTQIDWTKIIYNK